ncbi:hypothetical protein IJS98_07460 [bacterium]|nr:hypothetical protein [bacterium]
MTRVYAADVSYESGQAAEAFAGLWTETVAKRGRIDVSPNDDGTFAVSISWPNGAAEKVFWQMTARPAEPGAFVYDDGVCTVRRYSADGSYTEKTRYENGSGAFYLQGEKRLTWSDDMEGTANNSVFAKR